MNDILILAPTRRQLRGAVKVVNQMLGALMLEKHPDKTFIGRIERGFDFLWGRVSLPTATLDRRVIPSVHQWVNAERERGHCWTRFYIHDPGHREPGVVIQD